MPRPVLTALLGTLLLASVACEQAADDPASAPMDTVATAAEADDHAADDHSAHAAADGEGMALLPIMQRLGGNMTTLTHALMTDDHATVEAQAAAIAEHAPIAADELERIRSTLGADFARFAAVDESVHVAAVRLHEAARARDLEQVVTRLGEVQRGCVSCHAQFRDRLRTNPAGQ